MESENKELLEQAPTTGDHGVDPQAPESAQCTSESAEIGESDGAAEEPTLSRASPALLQAILLASGEPVSFVKLQEIMRCSRPEVVTVLEALQQHCATDISGVEVVAVGERLQLRTKVAFAEPVRELMAVKPRKLSQAALETLSVVAYQQPIVKSEIDKIRGVDVAPTLKTLLERKIIKIIGYQASVGQPSLYGTTDDFLRIFGLSSLAELPALRDLRALAAEPGEVGERGENIDVNGAAKEDGAVEEFVTTDKSNDDIVTVREVSNDDETSVSSGAQQITDDHPEVGNT
jgi:segregation and condensation protein B